MTSTLQSAKETVSTLALTAEERIKDTFSKPHRIDTHIHIIPPSFAKAVLAHGDPSGWNLPTWNTAGTIHAMNTLAIQTGVMSPTAPGPAVVGFGPEGRTLARQSNEECLDIVRSKEAEGRMKLFACTPSWFDVEGTVAEIEWTLDGTKEEVLGIVAMTSYEDRLLGDPMFKPIWDKLDALKAVVFIHPTFVNIEPRNIASWLPQPMIDYPQQSTRCAADLVFQGTITAHPNVKIILSHAGGTLPFLGQRALTLLKLGSSAFLERSAVTYEEAAEAISKLYYDVALSTSPIALRTLLEFTSPDKILYGSDFPYAPLPAGLFMTAQLDKFMSERPEEGNKLEGLNRENAEKLFGDNVKW